MVRWWWQWKSINSGLPTPLDQIGWMECGEWFGWLIHSKVFPFDLFFYEQIVVLLIESRRVGERELERDGGGGGGGPNFSFDRHYFIG